MTTTITTRTVKGSALTWSETDSNFNNLRETADTATSNITTIQSSQIAGSIGFQTVAEMNSDLAHAANTLATVTNDPTASNNTYWIKLGASGSGSWQKSAISPFLPYWSSRQFTTVAQAITAIGSVTPSVLNVSTLLTVTNGDIVPSNISVIAENGGIFQGTGTETITFNGPFSSGLYQVFSGCGLIAGLKYGLVEWFGAKGDGTTDDYTAIMSAINCAVASNGIVIFGAKTYAIGTTITLPATSYYARYMLKGAGAHMISKVDPKPGTTIKVLTNITAIKTPTLTAPNNTLAYWLKDLSISDIYVEGTQVLGDTETSSIGFDLSGVQFLSAHNLHAEGFGTGMNIENGSEIYLTGNTILQNNYNGAKFKRSSTSTTDLQIWADNLVTVNNDKPLTLDNVRSLFVKSGENITYGVPLSRTALNRIYIVNSSNSQIYFTNYIMENDEDIYDVSIDSAGLSILSFDKCNLESHLKNKIVLSTGHVDLIEIKNSAFERGLFATGSMQSLVVALSPSGSNDSLRANKVILSNNSPCFADMSVFYGGASFNPYTEFVPPGFIQVNPTPNLDEAQDNYITLYGVPVYTNSNVLRGKGRLYFTSSTANNFVLAYPTSPLIGARILYVSLIVDDNSGATIPTIYAIGGIGSSGTHWNVAYQSAGESYTVGARTFRKYIYGISIINEATIKTPGVTYVEIGNIFGGTSANGIESLNVYANAQDIGSSQLPKVRKRDSAPSVGDEGWAYVGDTIEKLTPTVGQPKRWKCTVAGTPGTWVSEGNL